MASVAGAACTRRCCVCGSVLRTSKSYKSLKPVVFRDEAQQEEERKKKDARINDIQSTINSVIDTSTFSCACDPCFRRVQKIKSFRREADELEKRVREDFRKVSDKENIITPVTTPSRSRSGKRQSDGTPSKAFSPKSAPSYRKRSLFSANSSDQSSQSSASSAVKPVVLAEISITHIRSGATAKREVPDDWIPIVEALCVKNKEIAAAEASKHASIKSHAFSDFILDIKRECATMCSKDKQSLFKLSKPEDLKKFSSSNQEEELSTSAPVFHAALTAAATGPELFRNKIKTEDTLVHGITAAAGTLLYCRSQLMNAQQTMTALQLRQGGASKNAIERLHKRFMCVSTCTVISLQDHFGKDFDQEVAEWKKRLVDEEKVEEEYKAVLGSADNDEAERRLTEFNKRRHPGYSLVGDNVDIRVHPRYMGIGKQTKDLHMYNMLGVENRINAHHLPNDRPMKHFQDFKMKELLPSVEDSAQLRQNWSVLTGRVMVRFMPRIAAVIEPYVPATITHKYMRQMKQKNKVVDLGVLMKNENTTEGMKDITTHQHTYVPAHDEDKLIRILSVGDQLTVERQCKALEDVRDSKTASERCDGMMPVFGDFHLLGNYYQALWKKCFNKASVGDVGTLAASKVVLQTKNVPETNPMNNMNATSAFLDKYTDALIITAALEFFGMDDVKAEPTKNAYDPSVHATHEEYTKSILNNFVDTYSLPSEQDISSSAQITCHTCEKVFKNMNAMRDHIKNEHAKDAAIQDNHDAVYAYSCATLSMCMLARDFTDARQLGDGGRLLTATKYMLLYFRSTGKTKYAYQTLRHLAAVKCFLTPQEAEHVIWNRFVNTKGRQDTNKELDRTIEHRNRIFKCQARQLHGQVQQATVDRISKSCQHIDKVLVQQDKATVRKASSGKRRQPDEDEDVLQLISHTHSERIFARQAEGRYHKAFPGFTRGYVVSVDHRQLHQWMKNTLEDLSRKHMFDPEI